MNIRNEKQYYCNAILAEELVVQWLQVHALAAHSGSRFDFHRIEFRCLASLSYSTLMAMLHGKSMCHVRFADKPWLKVLLADLL